MSEICAALRFSLGCDFSQTDTSTGAYCRHRGDHSPERQPAGEDVPAELISEYEKVARRGIGSYRPDRPGTLRDQRIDP